MIRALVSFVFAAALLLAFSVNASAHQPYFEDRDLTFDAPYYVSDPNVSLAYYATLDSPQDVDYFAFDGQAGQPIALELTIPQISGQENFAPMMALMGPGLPSPALPARVELPPGAGAQQLEPPPVARTFFEPFSGTSYWERQKVTVTLPATGRYMAAVWHPQGVEGRYVFVIGTREQFGGDLAFPFKMRQYWTPVVQIPTTNFAARLSHSMQAFLQLLRGTSQ